APTDGDEADANVPFCAGEVAFLSAPAWMAGSITAPADAENPGCADTFGKNLHAFPLPGAAAGEPAPIFAGGSNIAVAQLSDAPEMAKEAVKIMVSKDYQDLMAGAGLTPALLESNAALPDNDVAQSQAEALAVSKSVPTTPKWQEVEASLIIQDSLVRIAQGEDTAKVAEALDARIEEILNG